MSASCIFESFIEPFGTLWFIYLLPIFFVVIKADARAPPPADLGVAAAARDGACRDRLDRDRRVCARFVYFYSRLSVRRLCVRAGGARAGTPALALCWPRAMGAGQWRPGQAGYSEWPLVSLALGLAGACAIITLGTLLARMQWLGFLRFCGENSIVIYLAFFLPMATTRTLLLKTGLSHDIGTVSLIVTIAGVVGALVIWCVALAAGANFLFERPAAFWIAPKKPHATLQAAE